MSERMIETADGKHALCTEGRFQNWIMYKHPDGQWVSLRPALPAEIAGATQKHAWDNRHEPTRG